MRRLFIPLLCKLAFLACTPAAAEPPKTAPAGRVSASRSNDSNRSQFVQVDELVVTASDVRSAGELLAAAHLTWQHGDAAGAAAIFDLVGRLRSPVGAQAAYWAGLAWEEAGRHDVAALRFEALSSGHPDHDLAWDAALRAVRLRVFLDDWQRAGHLAMQVLGQSADWTAVQLVALHSAVALARLQQQDLDSAEYHLGKGRGYAERAGLDQLEVIPRDLAQLYFALGELRRLWGAGVTFVPLPRDFAAQFERRAQFLLDAQSCYLDVMRARDAHWSTMAGFRIGQLYQELHRDVLRAPRPPGITDEQSEAFVAALKLRYLVLLEKGLGMYERTLALAGRTGEESTWVARAAEQKLQLEAVLRRERAAIGAASYSEQDLRSILDEIQARQ